MSVYLLKHKSGRFPMIEGSDIDPTTGRKLRAAPPVQ